MTIIDRSPSADCGLGYEIESRSLQRDTTSGPVKDLLLDRHGRGHVGGLWAATFTVGGAAGQRTGQRTAPCATDRSAQQPACITHSQTAALPYLLCSYTSITPAARTSLDETKTLLILMNISQ